MTLICLGDSLTFGYGVSRSRCWTMLAQQESSLQILNLGVSGDTTGGMLTRLNTDVLRDEAFQGFRPDRPRVLLMGGANDIFYAGTDSGARANIGAMVHQLRARGSEPLVGIAPALLLDRIPENWKGILEADTAKKLDAFAAWLCRWCAAFSVQTVDFRPALLKDDGMPDKTLFLDGLHPNEAGHRRMAACLLQTVKEV